MNNLSIRQLARVMREHDNRYGSQPNLSRAEYNYQLREIAVELYPMLFAP